MKILLIDDSSTMRMLMVKILRELGYSDFVVVSNAEESIPLAFNTAFDVILTDWNLPKMSGLDLVKYLKNTPETQNIPIIMITSIHDRAAILKALKAGVQGYILKPVSKEIVATKLKEIESKTVVDPEKAT